MRIFFVLAIILLGPRFALACSCSLSTFEDSFRRATLVVSATVMKPVGSDRVNLHIDEVWKGQAPRDAVVKIVSGLSESCSPTRTLQPAEGTQYLLYLDRLPTDESGIIHLDTCSRNMSDNRYMQEDMVSIQEYRRKLVALDAAIAQSDGSMVQRYNKAIFLRENGDWQSAKKMLHTLSNEFPESSDIWAQLASLIFEKAEKIHGVAPEHKLLLKQKEAGYAESLIYADRALTLDGTEVLAKNVRQMLLLRLGRTDEANFASADFSKRYFKDLAFIDKEFDKTSFAESSLLGVEFTKTEMKNVSFENAHLMRTRFQATSIKSTNFNGAQLSDGAIRLGNEKASFEIGGFHGSQISDSSFKQMSFHAPVINTSIINSDFEGATFGGASEDSEQILLANVKARNSNFRKISTESQMGKAAVIRDSAFVNCDFTDAKLRARIINTDFSQAKLTGVDLSGSTIDCQSKWPKKFDPIVHGAVSEGYCQKHSGTPDFTDKKFDDYRGFGRINFENVRFVRAQLKSVHFYQTNLTNADFTDARVDGADFQEANLEGASFRNVALYGSSFRGSNLKGADFQGANLTDAWFDENDNLDEANLTLARLSIDTLERLPKRFDVEKHQFVYSANRRSQGDPDPCPLLPQRPVHMAGQDLTGVNLAYACLINADFARAKLDKGTLYAADLRDANLDGTSLVGTKYSCDTIIPEKYKPLLKTMILIEGGSCDHNKIIEYSPQLAGADLSGMNLWYADLRGADLRRADLRGTNLVGARLHGARLEGARLQGATYDHGTKWPLGFDDKAAGVIEGGIRGGNME